LATRVGDVGVTRAIPRWNGSPSELLPRRRIEMGSCCARGLENAVDGDDDGAEGPETYPPAAVDCLEGDECSDRRELKSEI